jgi:acyl-CoA synthetase (NDP forming)
MTDYYTLIPSFKKEIPNFFSETNTFVIFGVTSDPTSLGFQIFKNLKKDFKIFLISSKKEILGEKCYSNLSLLPEKPDAAIICTSSDITLDAIKECFKNGILKIWIELGSETSEAIEFCKKSKIQAIYFHSVLKERTNPSYKYSFREES